MITEKRMQKIVDACKTAGFNIRIRDIAYIVLCNEISDRVIAYRCIFGEAGSPDAYDSSSAISYLRDYIRFNGIDDEKTSGKSKKEKSKDELSFDENRAAMIRLLEDTQSALDEGTIEPKDAFKIMSDIRVKLSDKFSIKDEKREQVVVVEKKFNRICKYGYECYMPTKEELMEMYNLVEKE